MDQFPANIDNPPNAQNPQQQPGQQPLQIKKKPRETISLKPEHFQRENGIQALYKAIQSTDFRRGEDNVDMTMKKITNILKTWHYQMLPKFSFDLFLQRCKALGNHKFTQAYMSKVRRIHKGQEGWGTQQQPNQDPLNNVDLDHLNPNGPANQQRAENLKEKFENRFRMAEKMEEKRIETEVDEMAKMQQMLDDDDDEDDDMMKQMKAMDTKIQEKKEILANVNKNKSNQQHSDSEQVPYVPEGFDNIDYDQDSDYN